MTENPDLSLVFENIESVRVPSIQDNDHITGLLACTEHRRNTTFDKRVVTLHRNDDAEVNGKRYGHDGQS
jgi:hypothetical protein